MSRTQSKHRFVVGGTYRNRVGSFEVTQIERGAIHITYDSGDTAVCSARVLEASLASGRNTRLSPGAHVVSAANKLGKGKLLSLDGDSATVQYFRSVTELPVFEVPVDSLKTAYLWPQTRCYVRESPDVPWLMGRIGQRDGDRREYEVHFPDQWSRYFPESVISVRWNKPLDDPTETLVAKAHETPFFHDRRFTFVRQLTRQRAVARGLTGLLSASVELYPHQVEVIRRVLEDPIQRYLLADEVGLGKTIEAGVILRQFLLDEAEGKALIVVPPHLVDQWRVELDEKIRIEEFPDRVTVIGTDDALPKPGEYSTVIVDEAHHPCAWAFAEDRNQRAKYQSYSELAHSARRLLLLSATPALNHEQSFLAMLHLLEPSVYKLGDLEGFKQRIAQRQSLGRALLILREGTSGFVLKQTVADVKSMLAADSTVAAYCESMIAEPDVEKKTRIIRTLANHVSETYRLHRRMLRTRREEVHGVSAGRFDTTVPRLSLGVESDLDDVYADRVDELLEEWRVRASLLLAEQPATADNPGLESKLALIFITLFEAAASSPELLRVVVRARLEGSAHSQTQSDFAPERIASLCETGPFEGERAILEALQAAGEQLSAAEDRYALLALLVHGLIKSGSQSKGPKRVVVFSAFPTTARSILSRLEVELGEEVVAAHLSGMSRGDLAHSVAQLRSGGTCQVLVADSSAEEGLNLQWVDWCIHFDLPFAPNRIEQRIGRFDRVGRLVPLKSKVLVGSSRPETMQGTWLRFLSEGLGVFQGSIATLQFYVDRKVPEVAEQFFQNGVSGIESVLRGLSEEVNEERRRIHEEAVLDSIDAQNEEAQSFFDKLAWFESNPIAVEKETEPWLTEALRFDRVVSDGGDDALVTYQPTKSTLVPNDLLLLDLVPTLGAPTTYDRAVSVRVGSATIMRRGVPFVDQMEHYIRWDDRGRAFAMWRIEPSSSFGAGNEWVGFRFNYLLEADDGPARQVLQAEDWNRATSVAALQRVLDSFFPPAILKVFVDRDLQVVTDRALLAALERPYRSHDNFGNDFNLAKDRLSELERLFEASVWTSMCREAREASESTLLDHPEVQGAIARNLSLAELRLNRISGQLSVRQRSGLVLTGGVAGDRELEFTHALHHAFLMGIRAPRVTLDALGAYVLAKYPPAASGN